MPSIPFKSLPLGVQKIATNVATLAYCTVEDLFITDHSHGEVSRKGDYAIALEGGPPDWPHIYNEEVFEGLHARPAGYYTEAKASWCLGVYADPEVSFKPKA